MTRVDRIIILSLVAVMFVIAFGGIALYAPGNNSAARERSSGLSVDAHDQTLVVHGCHAEDSCRAGYHANGVWTIKEVSH
jgi:hypothetical protein